MTTKTEWTLECIVCDATVTVVADVEPNAEDVICATCSTDEEDTMDEAINYNALAALQNVLITDWMVRTEQVDETTQDTMEGIFRRYVDASVADALGEVMLDRRMSPEDSRDTALDMAKLVELWNEIWDRAAN